MAERDNRGRFTAGHGLSKGFGRPMELYKRSVQDAIAREFPPNVIVDLINESIEIARLRGSAKGVLAAVTEILDRTGGKPIQVEAASEGDKVAEMIEQWRISKLAVVEIETDA